MNPRAAMLLALLATQALASGLTSVVHLCSMESKPDTCRCQHTRQAEAPVAIRKHDCCKTELVQAPAAGPSLTDLRGQGTQVALPLTPAVVRFAALARPDDALPRLAQRGAPPEHGPPIFLRVHSLLN